jgi:hypothetical protein
MRQRSADIIVSSIVLVLNITLLLLTPGAVEEQGLSSGELSFPPWAFPATVLSILTLLSLWWLVNAFISNKNSMNESVIFFDKSALRVITTLILMFLGAYAVNILGFIATSVVMTGLLLIYFGIRDWKTILSLSIGMPLFIYIFFEVFMKIPLPEGIIFVREG